MSSTISPNMSLIIPTVGAEAGPQYATDINTSLSILDSHDHTSGNGVQITPAAININTTLSFNSNSLSNVAGIGLNAQTTAPSNNTLYESGTDLYFVDGLGNNVRLTQSGNVAGTPGSIANLVAPASVTFVSGSSTFVFQSAANVAGNLDVGGILMRNLTPDSTYYLNLMPPAGLSNNYNLVLPTLPNAKKIMTLDASGNMAAPYTVDGSTITINSNVIGVPTGGITATQIANSTITATQIATASIAKQNMVALGQLSTSAVTNSNNNTTPQQVMAPVTLTSTGRPVMMITQGYGSPGGYFGIVGPASGATGSAYFGLYVDGALVALNKMSGSTVESVFSSPTDMMCIYQPSAGTHTYALYAHVDSNQFSWAVYYKSLVVWEL